MLQQSNWAASLAISLAGDRCSGLMKTPPSYRERRSSTETDCLGSDHAGRAAAGRQVKYVVVFLTGPWPRFSKIQGGRLANCEEQGKVARNGRQAQARGPKPEAPLLHGRRSSLLSANGRIRWICVDRQDSVEAQSPRESISLATGTRHAAARQLAPWRGAALSSLRRSPSQAPEPIGVVPSIKQKITGSPCRLHTMD